MKINYKFATDEKAVVEVPEEIGQVILELEKAEFEKNRTETRRHSSIENLTELGGQFIDKTVDVENAIISSLENEKLYMAIQQLLPQQKELIKKVFFDGLTPTEIGRIEGVARQTIEDRLKRILKRLKNNLN